jgi:hypothetical protein
MFTRCSHVLSARHTLLPRAAALAMLGLPCAAQAAQAVPNAAQAMLTLPYAAQATLGLFAWTEEAKPAELACRAAHAETAAKAKLLARVGALGRAPHAPCSSPVATGAPYRVCARGARVSSGARPRQTLDLADCVQVAGVLSAGCATSGGCRACARCRVPSAALPQGCGKTSCCQHCGKFAVSAVSMGCRSFPGAAGAHVLL